MKKILLVLIISIIFLGAASILFSLEKPKRDIATEFLQNKISQVQLPRSRDTFLTASLNPNFIPIRDWSIKEPEIEAKAAGVFDFDGEKFLYQKNIKEKLSIASLTKIMTAIIALENLNLDNVITISKKAVMAEGENGRLVIGENLTARDLLYIMLIESSNDAAVALSNAVNPSPLAKGDRVNNFVFLMNKKAEEIGLESTNFVDSAGISAQNYSTIIDLAKLAKYSFTQNSLIWQILGIKEIEINSRDEKVKHHLVNTNKLLSENPQIIGGKTGFTEEAGSCMLVISKIGDKTTKYLITIVLGSENRELEIRKLIEWVKLAYVW